MALVYIDTSTNIHCTECLKNTCGVFVFTGVLSRFGATKVVIAAYNKVRLLLRFNFIKILKSTGVASIVGSAYTAQCCTFTRMLFFFPFFHHRFAIFFLVPLSPLGIFTQFSFIFTRQSSNMNICFQEHVP